MTAVQLKILLSMVNNRLQVEAISVRRVLRENPELWADCYEMWSAVMAEIIEPTSPASPYVPER